MDKELRNSLREVFQKTEAKTRNVQDVTGLKCPSGCGKCCSQPNIETSPLDWFLQAESILEEGKLEETLEILDRSSENSPCIYYISDPDHPGVGRCSSYENRPMVCRLFGYSAVRNKHGERKASICKIHKSEMPSEAERFSILSENSELVPVFSDLYTEFLGLRPNYSEQMQINVALKKALEILCLRPITPGDDRESIETINPYSDSSCLPEAI